MQPFNRLLYFNTKSNLKAKMKPVGHPGDCELARTGPSLSGESEDSEDWSRAVIEEKRQQFRVPDYLKPEGFEPFKQVKRSVSVALRFGVKLVVNKDEAKDFIDDTVNPVWCCLLCKNRPLKMRHDNTSPATTHLARAHGIRSRKTRSMLKNRAIRQQKLERSHRLHHLQPERFVGLQSALLLISGCLSLLL